MALHDDIALLSQNFKELFWGIGFFGWHLATLYALFVSSQRDLLYGFLFLVFFLLSGFLNHKVCKEFIHDLRPADYVLFLKSEDVRKRTNGMPSGHAQQTALALTVAYLFTGKYLYESIALFCITVWQRLVFKNHTALQLAVGGILGFVLGHIVYALMNRLEPILAKWETGSKKWIQWVLR